ncbi:hypothetical protein DFJ43DRAFT_31308 [Lentinula guzmanii]|uniref:Uncharacterized protein n=1 Tax=Lentinula guzmanii TaxID=2804957 RepID=A0AA38N2G2_9AGAR|nr:hypothetical protein DFJ43DRAFT_31308 [Lentinula guzmanii]
MSSFVSSVLPATSTPPPKRKLNTTISECEAIPLSSPSSRRRLSPNRSRRKPYSCYVKSPLKGQQMPSTEEVMEIQKPKSKSDNEGATQTLDRASNPMFPSTPEASLKHKHRKKLTSRMICPGIRSKTPVARHLRVLSRHIRHFQISIASNEGGECDSEAKISLTRIPSIMDVYLDAKSPSIDFTEEVLLEIADRIKRLSQFSSPRFALASSPTQRHCLHQNCECEYRHSAKSDSEYPALDSEMTALNPFWEEIWFGKNATGLGNSTRHPDSFERSTAAWSDSEGLNGK